MVYLEHPPNVKKFYGTKEYRGTYGPTLGKASTSREVFETYRPVQETIVKRLRPLLYKNMSVLDVGCSTGHFLDALKGKVKTRVGLELSRDEVAFIRKNLDFAVYNEPIADVEIAEGPFDLITCFQTLEHIDDPLSFLKAMHSHLKPSGHLYLELPNLDDVLLSVFENKEYADFYFREPHVSYFTRKTLGALLTKAGFKGRIGTVQGYNLTNHLHWTSAHAPQGNFKEGNGVPVLAKGAKANTPVGRALNAFIANADKQYRQLLEKHHVGESLTFLGTQR